MSLYARRDTVRAASQTLCAWLRLEGDDGKRLALIVAVALVVRVTWVLVFQTPPASDAAAYDGLALRLAQGEGYVTADGTPTAFWPIGYPAFLATLYIIFGHSWLAAGLANAFLGAVSVILTYRLAREFLCGRLSLVAAGVIALLPSHIISFTSVLRNEALHTVLVLAALIATCNLARHPNWKRATLLGLILGIGVYVRPILLLFPIVIMAMGGSVNRKLGLAGIALLVCLLTISPWTVRNYLVMGEPILTATNGGTTFWIGNGHGATGEFRDIPENTFSSSSEIVRYREGIELGLRNIVEHPGEWISILPSKFFHLWASDRYNIHPSIMPESYRGVVPILWVIAQGYWTIIVIAAALAAITRPVRSYWLKFPGLILSLTLLYWTAFHMMFHGEGRFHIQVIPLVVIVGVHLLLEDQDWKAWLPSRLPRISDS